MKDIELFNDHFQNYKTYGIPKAQLIIADIPYNIGKDAYGSNPSWYINGDNSNGESELAGKTFFDTDNDFRISEFLHFCKNFSAQVLKANMRIVGNCEYGVLLYRDKLPKFNNDGRMVFNCMQLIKFLTDDGVTKWEDWHGAHEQAAVGSCPYMEKCHIHARSIEKLQKKGAKLKLF